MRRTRRSLSVVYSGMKRRQPPLTIRRLPPFIKSRMPPVQQAEAARLMAGPDEVGLVMSTVGLPPPMRADARRNRELLLAAALAAFTERGADDTSLEEIARRAGVGIGTLYRH